MNTARFFMTAAVLMFTLSTVAALAQDDRQGPKELIEDTTDRVLRVFEEHQNRQDEAVTEEMAEEMLEALQPAIDFNSIALGIMGKHRDAASEWQQQRFTRVLKDTLARLYLENFDNINVKNVEVLDLPSDFNAQTDTSVSVQMRATTRGGDSYSLTYSMRRNAEEGWRVLNIIAEGVNLGLTYRNQFDDLMSRHDDLDRVIDAWPKAVEDND